MAAVDDMNSIENEKHCDWSRDLENLEFILNEAKNCLPNESEAISKSKANPLLEELLDKPINNVRSAEKRAEKCETNGRANTPVTSNDTDSDDVSSEGSEEEQSEESSSEESEEKSTKEEQKNETNVAASKPVKKKQRKVMKSLMRKNIKKILNEKDLDFETRNARKEEEERIKRLHERSQFLQRQRQMQQQITITSKGRIDDVCVLISDDESDAPNKRFKKSTEVIDLLDDDEDDIKPSFYPPSNLSSYKTSYTVPPVTETEDDSFASGDDDGDSTVNGDDEDMNNCGVHTDDSLNVPDEQGRVLVNVGHNDDEIPVYLPPHLARHLKPHQIGGIRFLYDNLIENLSQFDRSLGYGCILAHSMGLGKTLQIISFIDIFLTYTSARHVLCIVPINTLQNWIAEFDMWLPVKREANNKSDNDIKYREFNLYALSDCKTIMSRAKEIMTWKETGGVLLLGYEMYRILTSKKCFNMKKIWNHPDILWKIINDGKPIDDLDFDVPTKNKKLKVSNDKNDTHQLETGENDPNNMSFNLSVSFPSTSENNSTSQRIIDYEWARPYCINYIPGIILNGLKMVILFEIIAKTLSFDDRLLIFSQSLSTLDIIENFLEHSYVPLSNTSERWLKNRNYYRLDGSTSAQEREKLINNFNNNRGVYLFLLSTRAGCLGINLVGANRIVVFDASWNPCHDAQAACRIYRYGQQKECFIYRLICDNSLEKKIYDRQVSKQGMSHRVVDELNPETNFTWKEINSLIEDLDQINEPPIKIFSEDELSSYDDEIVRHICSQMNNCITKEPFEHESLLLDHKETKLSQREKRFAEQSYLLAKHQRVLNSQGINTAPSYVRSGYFPPTRGGSHLGRPPNNAYFQPSHYPQYNTSIYNCPGNMLPTQPTPVPTNAMPNNYLINQTLNTNAAVAETLTKQGHIVKRITVPNDLNIPMDTNNERPPIFVPKGQEVLIIKNANGIYLRTIDGRLVAVTWSPSDVSNIFGPNANFSDNFLRSSHPSMV
ncbi:helicase ARIP4-like protein [Dinothrombium tinctorium]|uniref:Helicase ARIP4-like protein n=1 Tax=Dinothrombium tinctorium TaxID=1965070 RepID=A0A3S4RBH7_9ACAR|nr:helicase ARIP4-like protein [Dinothrombium tinctorium]